MLITLFCSDISKIKNGKINEDSCLQVTLVCVPDPGAIFVKLLHHRHGDKGEGGVHVGVLCINQDSDFVDTSLRNRK